MRKKSWRWEEKIITRTCHPLCNDKTVQVLHNSHLLLTEIIIFLISISPSQPWTLSSFWCVTMATRHHNHIHCLCCIGNSMSNHQYTKHTLHYYRQPQWIWCGIDLFTRWLADVCDFSIDVRREKLQVRMNRKQNNDNPPDGFIMLMCVHDQREHYLSIIDGHAFRKQWKN